MKILNACKGWCDTHPKSVKALNVVKGTVVFTGLVVSILGLIHLHMDPFGKVPCLQESLNFIAQGHGDVVFGVITGVTGLIASRYLIHKARMACSQTVDQNKDPWCGRLWTVYPKGHVAF